MNKKVILTITCISMLMIGAIPAYGLNEDTDLEDKNEIVEKVENYLTEGYTPDYFVITSGPAFKLLSSVELEGPENQTVKIDKLLNRRFVLFSRMLPVYPVFVHGINFTVEYKRDVRNLSRFSFYSYNTTILYNESGKLKNITDDVNISNIKHKIIVHNFSGLFIFNRAKLVRRFPSLQGLFFKPADFCFMGGCDSVTYT